MSAATDLLSDAIADQTAKLDALREEYGPAIQEGLRRQADVDRQARHVRELQEALAAVEHAERVGQVPVAEPNRQATSLLGDS